MTEKQKTVIINGEEVPVVPAKAEEEVLNKRTGKKTSQWSNFREHRRAEAVGDALLEEV